MVIKRDTFLYLWFGYIVLFPFYLFPSGGLQIADILVIVLFGLLSDKLIPTIFRDEVSKAMSLFIVYVLFVNFFWFIYYFDIGIVKNNFFYIFNALVFLTVIELSKRKYFWEYSLYALITVNLLQLCLLPFGNLHGNYRPIIFFNNPNQLGYWSILNLAVLWILDRRLFLKPLVFYSLFLLSLFFTFLSLSRGAMVAGLILALVMLFVKSKNVLVIGLVVAVPILIFNYGGLSERIEFLEKIEKRVSQTGERKNDSAEGRGFDRIINHPSYLILGAGEGKFDRFRTKYLGEIHSSPATILFSYGALGTFLFLIFIGLLSLKNNWKLNVIIFSLFIYSLAHMGLRFSLFWVVLALLNVEQTSKINS